VAATRCVLTVPQWCRVFCAGKIPDMLTCPVVMLPLSDREMMEVVHNALSLLRGSAFEGG